MNGQGRDCNCNLNAHIWPRSLTKAKNSGGHAGGQKPEWSNIIVVSVVSDLVIDGVLLALGFFRRTIEIVVLLIRGLSDSQVVCRTCHHSHLFPRKTPAS